MSGPFIFCYPRISLYFNLFHYLTHIYRIVTGHRGGGVCIWKMDPKVIVFHPAPICIFFFAKHSTDVDAHVHVRTLHLCVVATQSISFSALI